MVTLRLALKPVPLIVTCSPTTTEVLLRSSCGVTVKVSLADSEEVATLTVYEPAGTSGTVIERDILPSLATVALVLDSWEVL